MQPKQSIPMLSVLRRKRMSCFEHMELRRGVAEYCVPSDTKVVLPPPNSLKKRFPLKTNVPNNFGTAKFRWLWQGKRGCKSYLVAQLLVWVMSESGVAENVARRSVRKKERERERARSTE